MNQFKNAEEILEYASREVGIDQEDTLWKVYGEEPDQLILRNYSCMVGNIEYTKRLLEVMPQLQYQLIETLMVENKKLANKIMELQKGLK